MKQEIMGFWDTVASAGPYANNRAYTWLQTDNHTNTSSQIFTGLMLFLAPTNSVKALKANVTNTINTNNVVVD